MKIDSSLTNPNRKEKRKQIDVVSGSCVASDQALGKTEGERKEEGLYAHLKFNLLFRPFLDVSIIYAKYLARNLGRATEMTLNITLVDDFLTFNILNCKNYLHLSIKL